MSFELLRRLFARDTLYLLDRSCGKLILITENHRYTESDWLYICVRKMNYGTSSKTMLSLFQLAVFLFTFTMKIGVNI